LLKPTLHSSSTKTLGQQSSMKKIVSISLFRSRSSEKSCLLKVGAFTLMKGKVFCELSVQISKTTQRCTPEESNFKINSSVKGK
jgi:hypothetical protein